MGSAAVCAKTKPKNMTTNKNEHKTFNRNLDDYLKTGRNKKSLSLNYKDKNNPIYSPNNIKNLSNEINNGDDIYDNKDNLVFQAKPPLTNKNEENENFNKYLKTGKLPASNLTEILNANNLLKISLDLLTANQQAKIKNINHINLFNCVTFPRILNDINLKDSVQVIETTEISEKTNFRIVYNKNMQDTMNNLFFPEEFKMQQRNTINFTANSISFRDLPLPLSQLNVTTSNINGMTGNIMEISNLNNLNFNTQPNDDMTLKRKTSNFTNFNRKVKNYYLETDKISSCNNDTSSNNLDSTNMKNKESIASKTLKQLYDKVFRRNSIKTPDNQAITSQKYGVPNNASFHNSVSPNMDTLRNSTVFSKNKSFVNYLPKTSLYTIEDCNYEDCNAASKIYRNLDTSPNLRKKNSDVKATQPNDKLARKLYYSLEVRSRILEKKEKEKELMMRSLSDLEEEYNQLQQEINPIFNIKNAVDDSNYYDDNEESKRNLKYLNTIEKNNKIKNSKNSKKEPLFEINIKDLIKETINERLMTENIKDKVSDKSKIIKFKNININNININIQTNTEANYSNIYRKKPKTNSTENVKENFVINASSEFINSIETFTNINNTNYDKKNPSKLNSLRKIDKPKNQNAIFSKRHLIGYSNNSLKNKYSNISSSKKIEYSEAEKRRKGTNKTFDLNNNINKSNTYLDKTKKVNLDKNKYDNKSKLSSNNNCEDIFSNVVIESPLIVNNGPLDYFNENKTNSNNNLENFNIPTITLPERNSYTNNNINEKNYLNTSNNNIDSTNNLNLETDHRNMNIDGKGAFPLKKYATNSLISDSKSFTESELVSSFDSKELATLQDESENNLNTNFNKSNDKDSNVILTQGYLGNFNNGDLNRKSEYLSFNNNNGIVDVAYNMKENETYKPGKKEINLNFRKRKTMIETIPKLIIGNFIFLK